MNFQKLAGILADSPFFSKSQKLWELNRQDWNFPLSKLDKLLVGTHLILRDYAKGLFPPTFDDQQQAYDAEIAYKYSLPGCDVSEVTDSLLRKPFWFGKVFKTLMTDFIDLVFAFEQAGIQPPQKLLELGCGAGWMDEFLALMEFRVVGTSISPHEIQDAQARVKSIEEKHLKADLEFRTAPMESVADYVQDCLPFDAVFVYEALHHAYDWRQAIESSYVCLKPDGWLLIANEPNLIHTLVSYRVALLSNTHEIGFTRSELIQHLKKTGFKNIRILKNSLGFYIRPHWIMCQR